jgi:NADH-quinone oxidoreductase subunit M
MSVPYLSIILLAPLAGALIVMLLPRESRTAIRAVSLLASLVSFTGSIIAYLSYRPDTAGFQLVEEIPWFPNLGVSYILGVDGVSLPLVLLAGILSPACILISFSIGEREREYYALALSCLAGVFGVFETLDLFFFVLFYELASIPMYFLIGIWGHDRTGEGRRVTREFSALKLTLYLQLGGGLVLLGILGLYFATGGKTFDIRALAGSTIIPAAQALLFPILLAGFAIEAGMWPLHTWLPDGHSAAPTALSMILAGVLLKMGGYGIIRLCIDILPRGAASWLPFFMILAATGVIYGAMCALAQRDIKYIIAYSSVSHMGLVLIGIGALNAQGLNGAVFQMFSHGIATALLFALAGLIYEKTHTRDLDDLGGLAVKTPYLASAFIIACLASLGLPGLSGFIAEFLIILGAFKYSPWAAAVAVFSLVLTAAYLLRAAERIFLGPLNSLYEGKTVSDARGIERVPLAALALVTAFFGFFPSFLVNVTRASVETVLQRFTGGLP